MLKHALVLLLGSGLIHATASAVSSRQPESKPVAAVAAGSALADLVARAEAGNAAACWLLYRVYTDAIYEDTQIDPELRDADRALWPIAQRACEENKHKFTPEPAVRWLRRGVELKSPSCMDELGGLLECGRYDGVTKDQARAVELYEEAAAAGYYMSMVALADHYDAGTCGLAKDAERAAKLRTEALAVVRRAADAGDARATLALGSFYRHGYAGLEKDPARDFELNRKAAEAGEVVAMAIAGWYLYRGLGVERDEREGIRWLQKGVERKGPYAMYLIACLIGEGKVEGSVERAGELFVEAAARGVPRSMYAVGRGHATGEWGLREDSKLAKKWLRRAADANEPEAMFDLGCISYKGWDEPADRAGAAEWFERAAELDHAESMRVLAGMYLAGHGLSKDPAKAVQLLTRAVGRGNIEAKYDLAACLLAGIGVAEDRGRARQLLNEAADAGSDRARKRLEAEFPG